MKTSDLADEGMSSGGSCGLAFLFVDEAIFDKGVEVVPRRTDRKAKGPRDGSEVVPGEETQMVVDLSTDRMLESGQQAQAD